MQSHQQRCMQLRRKNLSNQSVWGLIWATSGTAIYRKMAGMGKVEKNNMKAKVLKKFMQIGKKTHETEKWLGLAVF